MFRKSIRFSYCDYRFFILFPKFDNYLFILYTINRFIEHPFWYLFTDAMLPVFQPLESP